jgi:glycerol-3-phosphate dehydrogenase (NAD(P)+)
MAKIAIVGAGLMGTATAWPLSDNNHSINLVGTHLDGEIIDSCKSTRFHPRLKRHLPEGVQPYFIEEIASALEGVQIIVSGVNSLGVHWIGRTLAPYLQPEQLLIAVTKGLKASADGSPLILPDVLCQELPPSLRDQVALAAIGGPCIAGELAGRRQSCVIFGSQDAQAVEHLAQIFRTSYYHIQTTTNLLSLELSAALKNAYTLGVGLAAGILERAGGVDEAGAFMHNLSAAMFAQGCTEIAHLLKIYGGDPSFAYKLPVAGDLYVTAQGGRSVKLARLLGSGIPYAEARQIMAGETLEAAEIVKEMGEILPYLIQAGLAVAQEFPLMRLLVDVVVHGKTFDATILSEYLDVFYRLKLS